MNSRERMMAAIDRKAVDRIPSDLWCTAEVLRTLEEHFDVEGQETVYDCLGVDGMGYFGTRYVGKDRSLPDGTEAGIWGTRFEEQVLPTGGTYIEQTHCPLKDVADIRELDDFNWEDPADYDFEEAAETCKDFSTRRATISGYQAPFYDLCMLFGQETALMNLALRPELVEAVLDRAAKYRLEEHRLLFEATKGYLDITQVTDDFGSQANLVMSAGTIRSIFWPHYRNAIKLAKSYGLRVFHHDDGAMSELIPDLIEMGVDVLNPIQWKCPGMDLERLKREFGKQICFHGSVENQEIIPFGTTDAVRAEVRKNLRILGSDGTGFVIGPCHNIQSGTPLENILAMYDEIQKVTGA